MLSFESRPTNRPDKLYRHVLLVQYIFSRFLWGIALSIKGETRAAFESILDRGTSHNNSTLIRAPSSQAETSKLCFRAV